MFRDLGEGEAYLEEKFILKMFLLSFNLNKTLYSILFTVLQLELSFRDYEVLLTKQ